MRKLLLIFAIIPLVVFGILILKGKNTNPQKSSAASVESINTTNDTSNTLQINNLNYSWYEVTNLDKLKLIPNFEDKETSTDIMNIYSCQFLSSASFYQENGKVNKPLGLVIADSTEVFSFVENTFFDGILSVNDMATPRITRTIPQDHLQIAVQTGPIIKENGSFINLKLQQDKNSRRILAGITGNNKLFFITIYDPNQEFSGPFLGNLKKDLPLFEEKSGLTFADVINLDGGAASTFNTKNLTISEITPVGAFFCQHD